MMCPEVWKKNILDTVQYIADKNMQKTGWFQQCDYSSHPDELYDWLFDDNDIEGYLISKNITITEKQRHLGNILVNEMELYDKNNPGSLDPMKVINDPEWDKVIVAAQNFYQAMLHV